MCSLGEYQGHRGAIRDVAAWSDLGRDSPSIVKIRPFEDKDRFSTRFPCRLITLTKQNIRVHRTMIE